MVIYGLADILDEFDTVTIIKISPQHRKSWMTGARPEHRFAVALGEGGAFGYGVDVNEALTAAANPVSRSSERAPHPKGERAS